MIDKGEANATIEVMQMIDRGITCFHDKYAIEPSTFTSYANTRMTSKESPEGIWFYN